MQNMQNMQNMQKHAKNMQFMPGLSPGTDDDALPVLVYAILKYAQGTLLTVNDQAQGS